MEDHFSINVLYIGFALLGDQDPTGQTLEHIYAGCSRVRILQLCMDYSSQYHETQRETVYISPHKSRAYYWIKKKYRSGGLKAEYVPAAINTSRVSGNSIVNLARCLLDILPRGLEEDTYKRIEDFKPDCIFTLGENIATDIMALKLSKKYEIPIVLHVMDNLEDSFCAQSLLLKPFRQRYLSLNRQLFERTIENFAIGEKMAQEYAKRHKQPFTIAMNCLDSIHEQPHANNTKLKLLFSGGLHGGRADTLKTISEIIANNTELSDCIELLIYTSSKHIEQYGATIGRKCKLLEYVPREKLFENLGQADILLHVESFDQREIEFFRYSMSTKIPEYLSVGRPILCFGPKDICTVDYIEHKGVGISADTEEQVEMALLQLSRNAELRKQYGKRALDVAQNEHLQKVVSARVTNMLRRVVQKWSEDSAN